MVLGPGTYRYGLLRLLYIALLHKLLKLPALFFFDRLQAIQGSWILVIRQVVLVHFRHVLELQTAEEGVAQLVRSGAFGGIQGGRYGGWAFGETDGVDVGAP